MKYTDKFFRIPVKMYDRMEIDIAELKEQQQLLEDPQLAKHEPASWIQCWSYILPDNIIGYDENFSREMEFDELTDKGPDITLVHTDTHSYPCLWKISKFEQKLNEFIEQQSSNSINIQKNQ